MLRTTSNGTVSERQYTKAILIQVRSPPRPAHVYPKGRKGVWPCQRPTKPCVSTDREAEVRTRQRGASEADRDLLRTTRPLVRYVLDRSQLREQFWLELLCSVDGPKYAMRNEVGILWSSLNLFFTLQCVFQMIVEYILMIFVGHVLYVFVLFLKLTRDFRQHIDNARRQLLWN